MATNSYENQYDEMTFMPVTLVKPVGIYTNLFYVQDNYHRNM